MSANGVCRVLRVLRVVRARVARCFFARATARARSTSLRTVSSVSLKKNRPQRANLRFSPSPRVLFLLASGTRGLFACFDTKLNSELGAFSHENVQRRLDVERDFRPVFPSAAFFSSHTPSFFPFFVFVKSPRVFSSHTPSFLSIFAGVTRVLRASAFVACSVRRGDRRGAPHSTRRPHTRVAGTFTLANVPRTSRS